MSTQLTVVTGGGRGIGAAISRRLARQGHDVVITYRQDQAAAEEVAEQVRRSGRRALVAAVEMTDPGSIAELFDRVASFGALTGLVNNAGAAAAVGRWRPTTSRRSAGIWKSISSGSSPAPSTPSVHSSVPVAGRS